MSDEKSDKIDHLDRIIQEANKEKSRALRKRKLVTLTLVCIGIVLLVTGYFLAFYFQQGLKQGSYTVKAGASLELSAYLEKGDDIEGGFSVSGGNGQANLIIKDPSGEIIENWTVTGQYEGGWTPYLLQETGTYTMIFKNLDSIHDQTINVFFFVHDNFHIWFLAGWLMIVLSIPFLLSAIFRLLSDLSHRRTIAQLHKLASRD